MPLSIGIVGLPNVGKSTLFNALTSSSLADAQNYPFCTIEPNRGIVEVPDERLAQLASVSKSEKIIPTIIEFVDIAGLVRGAHKGEGLGNQFLSHIREVDAIVHVVRAFQDAQTIHISGTLNMRDDMDIVATELTLADLESAEKRLEKLRRDLKGNADKKSEQRCEVLQRVRDDLDRGIPVRKQAGFASLSDEFPDLPLLTAKPQIIVVNTDEQQITEFFKHDFVRTSNFTADTDDFIIPISAKFESELGCMAENERKSYLEEFGIHQSGLDRIIIAGYKALRLVTFFTSGEPETRAWTVVQTAKAPEAAGRIHTDFQKKFIRAEVVDWKHFVEFGGWSGAKNAGLMRLEGKEYSIQDGDVCFFRVAQ